MIDCCDILYRHFLTFRSDTPSRVHQLLADITEMITFVKVIVVNYSGVTLNELHAQRCA